MANPFKPSFIILLTVIILAGCISPAPTMTPAPTPAPAKGSPGMGDPYYPNLGNGGYDVQKYTIALEVDPPGNTVNGSTTILANATEQLSAFNLDFHGLSIDSVRVNDKTAEFTRSQDELTITPSEPLEKNLVFTVVIKYHGTPGLIRSTPIDIEMGWSHARDGTINVWGEPAAASTWFPNNNHPRDKATYTFEITVPKSWMVVATGTLQGTKEDNDKTTFIWEMNMPMATYLASISIGQYKLFTQAGPNGMTIRNYFPADYPSSYRLRFNILPGVIDFFARLFGPYPFDEYGVVIASKSGICETTELALEAQSMSLHCPSDVMSSEPVIIHELAHQWFGDSVSLENWKDMWLKEGLATYAEWLWDSKNEPVALARIAKSRQRYFSDTELPVAEPAADNLYTDESYTGGALVLHALHLQVGDEIFIKILQTYAERYRYGNAGTDEFIVIAEEVSSQDLGSFFDLWLFSERMPDLPD